MGSKDSRCVESAGFEYVSDILQFQSIGDIQPSYFFFPGFPMQRHFVGTYKGGKMLRLSKSLGIRVVVLVLEELLENKVLASAKR